MIWNSARQRLTIAGVEFQRSTNALDVVTRRRFALLGLFVPKPAAFDLAAMTVALMEDPRGFPWPEGVMTPKSWTV